MASVFLTSNFFKNARGLTISDGGGVTWSFNKNTNTLSASGSSGGVLSSVGLADTSTTPIYTVTNSPLTNNGTIDITLNTQVKNLVFAGPTTGANAQPTFRAMVVADLPTGIPNANLQNSSLTVTAGTGLTGGGAVSLGGLVTLSLSTPVSIANGGTGQSTAAAAYNALSPMTTLGDIEYESGMNTAARLAGNTTATKLFLTQTGTGSVSAAPAWAALVASDIGALGANPTAKVALAAVNGSDSTFMRSDGAPALDTTISPTWTGAHVFSYSGAGVDFKNTNANGGYERFLQGSTVIGYIGNGSNLFTGASTNDFGLAINTASVMRFAISSGATALAIASTGAITASAPTGGDTLTTTNVAGGNALVVNGNAAGTAVIRLNTQATTGAQTATFSATNKPGSGATAPTKWVPLNIDGTTMYFPLWL